MLSEPYVVPPDAPVGGTAAEMTARELPHAVVEIPGDRYGLITDALIRQRVVARGRGPQTPASAIMDYPAPSTSIDVPVSDAVLNLLDHDSEVFLVTEPSGQIRADCRPTASWPCTRP
ncbi:MAG: hypothetical protein WAW85_02220 [Gordonia sp. (in: high G+C Gram-positive bacteria)]|uniref:CBS domain-containing protein n=1 Tax=Gordonia sp. (in: high G+C Gram-positive bacteria) TaxID=84139 RepID=UPI003BB70EB7